MGCETSTPNVAQVVDTTIDNNSTERSILYFNQKKTTISLLYNEKILSASANDVYHLYI